jgi:hypothetical protein
VRCYRSRDMQDATGTLEKVVLERIPTSHIADKRQMFDHFIRVSALYNRKSAHASSPQPLRLISFLKMYASIPGMKTCR